MRRLLLLISATVLLDTSFYAAITPLLPYYADQLELTKASAGVLAAAYPAGTMIAALPTGWIGARVGAKRMLYAGLVLLAVSSLTFGFARELWLLDLARFAQGVGGAAMWTGGLGWLSQAAPRERRAELMGTAFSAAVGGALLGPIVGAVARSAGPEVTFAVIAGLAVVLLAFAVRVEVPVRPAEHLAGGIRAALGNSQIARGALLVGISGVFFGVLDVLLPLELDDAGAGGTAIAAIFLTSAALEAAVSPPAGRYADRRGWYRLARIGLCATAALSLVASLPDAVGPLAVIGVACGPLVGVLWIPGLWLLSHGSDAAGIDHSYAFAVQNLTWAGAQTIGSAGGGALARATTDFVPYSLVAAVALAMLAATGARARRAAASSA